MAEPRRAPLTGISRRPAPAYAAGLLLNLLGVVVLWSLDFGPDRLHGPGANSALEESARRLLGTSSLALVWSAYALHWAAVAWPLQVLVRGRGTWPPAGGRGAAWRVEEDGQSAARRGIEELGALLVIVLAVRGREWTGLLFVLLGWMIGAAALAYLMAAAPTRLKRRFGGSVAAGELTACLFAVLLAMLATGLESLTSPATAWLVFWSGVSYAIVRTLERDAARSLLLVAMPAAVVAGPAMGLETDVPMAGAASVALLLLPPAGVALAWWLARPGGSRRIAA